MKGHEVANRQVDRMLYLLVGHDFGPEDLVGHRLEVLDLVQVMAIGMVDYELIECHQMTWSEGRSHRSRRGSNHLHHHLRRNRRLRLHPNRCYHHEFV